MPAHRITANAISETLEEEKPKKFENLKLPPKLVEKLRRRALDIGVSVEDLLEEMLGESEPVEEIKEEEQENSSEAIDEDFCLVCGEALYQSCTGEYRHCENLNCPECDQNVLENADEFIALPY